VTRLVEVAQELKGSTALVEHIVPALDVLTNDPENNVRRAFALTLVPLCNSFPRDAAATLLVPFMQQLTPDEFYSVRHNVVADLHLLQDNGPNGILITLVPQLLVLAKDAKWRVRKTIIEKISLLAEALGRVQFERKLQNLLINCLADHVAAIRAISCIQSAKVIALFGAAWAQKSFFPSAFLIYDRSTNYLHRMTCLILISNCASEAKITGDVYQVTFMPILTQAFTDEVANVRLMAAQTLYKVIPHLSTSDLETVQTALEVLQKDADADVSYFASLCSTRRS
jgi:serine/threonine-protein phosphatase 2A regulatory subunit A